uniref:alpha-galactosidase n=1 Tax=Mesorhizobium sp. JB07 TaxID=1163476 RepID=A0A0M3KU33_9HYPH|nr:alpha-galactosidase [Mesorhizobium sp. JB07]
MPAAPRCWRLDTPAQTLVLASTEGRLPVVAYWGAPLGEGEDCASLAQALIRPLGHGILDHVGEVSLCPEEGRAFQGQPGIRAFHPDGQPLMTQFVLDGVETAAGSLVVRAVDAGLGLAYRATFSAPGGDVIVAEAELDVSGSTGPVRVEWLSAPVIALPETASGLLEFAGRWTQEFGPRRVAFSRGVHLRESRRGRTGQDHFPGLIVTEAGCTETSGEARALTFAFSGVNRILVEEMADGQRQVQAGIAEAATIEARETLRSEAVHLAYSGAGLNGIASAYQAHVRANLVTFPEAARERPVHYNCWEAVYFRHDVAELKELANRAAAIGAERFVLDDGWFGTPRRSRDDDTTSLGDWTVDAKKFPDGLGPLIDHVEGLGMRFGLWVEPEMVNLDSDLARAHPDWIIMPEGRTQWTGRGQHVLDFTNPAVTDHIFACLDALLAEYRIDYLKWDMNRDLTLAVDRTGRGLLRRQTEAVYALIDRLRKKHPAVEIESCASGGGRIDYGILARTHRVWLSDSNDAHERCLMQHEAMLFLPPEIVGSHVGPRHCHTSGRHLSMAFRAGVALTGHMGFEMDLRELDAAEEATLKRYTAFYKENRGWMHAGRQLRLEPAGAETVAHISVDSAQSRFLAFSATVGTIKPETASPLKLAGLDPDARYRVRLWNRDEVSRPPTRAFASPLLGKQGLVLSGRVLMQSGIVLPLAFPDTMCIVEGHRVEGSTA